jgi:hypothetical protein
LKSGYFETIREVRCWKTSQVETARIKGWDGKALGKERVVVKEVVCWL